MMFPLSPEFRRLTLALMLSSSIVASPALADGGQRSFAISPAVVEGATPVLLVAQNDVAADYSWSARKAETGAVTISGEVPSLQAGKSLRGAAGDNVVDIASVRAGAPSDFEQMAEAGLAVLQHLQSGEVNFSNGAWHLTGTTTDPEAARLAKAAMRQNDIAAPAWQLEIAMPKVSEETAPQPSTKTAPKPAETEAEAGAKSVGTISAKEKSDKAATNAEKPVAVAAPELPKVEAYEWSAEKAEDGAVRFHGYVPARALQKYQEIRAGKSGTDDTKLAKGAPEDFVPHVMAALDILDQLAEGKVTFGARKWNAVGVAKSAEARSAAQAVIGADDAWTASIALPPPPVVSPYTWAVQKTGKGQLSLTGFVPTPQLQRYLEARVGGGAADETKVAAGAPDGFISDSIAAIDALAELENGTANFDGSIWRLTGRAKSALAADSAKALLEKADTPASKWKVAIAAPPAAPVLKPEQQQDTPPETAPAVSATGQNPQTNESAQPAIAAPAIEQEALAPASDNDMGTEAGAADTSSDGAAQIGKQPEESAAASKAAPASGPAEPEQQAVVRDYPFVATLARGGKPVLSGAAPTGPAARYLAVVATGDAANALGIRPDAPPHFITDATSGLEALRTMEQGELRYGDGIWTLTGTVHDEATRKQIEAQVAALPDAAQWRVEVNSPAPLDICRNHVEQLAGRNAILFNSGSDRLTEGSRSAIDELATYLQECPTATVEVEGHTDSDGDAASNMALSVARAEAVRDALVERGVNAQRLYAVGYGESLPIASNDTREGKQRNRRIAFKILEHPEDLQQ